MDILIMLLIGVVVGPTEASRVPTAKVSSSQNEIIYEMDEITLQCEGLDFVQPTEISFQFENYETSEQNLLVGCRWFFDFWDKYYQGKNHDVMSYDCRHLNANKSLSLTVQFSFRKMYFGDNIANCIIKTQEKLFKQVVGTKFRGADLPVSLNFHTIYFEDGVPVMNRKVMMRCVSDPDYPPSSFIYGIKNRTGGVRTTQPQSTDILAEIEVTHDFESGFVTFCQNVVHTKGNIYLEKGCNETYCLPHYLKATGGVKRMETGDPYLARTFYCSIQGYPEIKYEWLFERQLLASKSESMVFQTTPEKFGTKQNFYCKASTKFFSVTVSIQVLWNRTTGYHRGLQLKMLIGILSASFSYLILFLTYHYIIKKKKERSGERTSMAKSYDEPQYSADEYPQDPYTGYSHNDDNNYVKGSEHDADSKQNTEPNHSIYYFSENTDNYYQYPEANTENKPEVRSTVTHRKQRKY